MSNYEILKEAIEQKKSVSCTYDGYSRKMSPHTLGKNGERMNVLSVQYGGYTSKGPIIKDDWKCLHLDKIMGLSINSDSFHTLDNHSQQQRCIEVVLVVIDY